MSLQSYSIIPSRNEVRAGTVLIIDDSRLCREMVTDALKNAGLFGTYLTAGDGVEGLKVLAEIDPDLVICDLEMPRLDGLHFLHLVNAQPHLRETPVIIVTGNSERKAKLMGLEHGASDYLTKPVDDDELVARVKIQLKIKKLQDELRAAKNHFKELSNTDPLTGLYNRRFFSEILEGELQRARRLRSCVSLLVVDIDHFKGVNDKYGHQVGDHVLVEVADCLRKGLRSYDVASRYGGEEFVLILPATPLQAGIEVAERLRQSVENLTLDAPMQGHVTVSIGISSFPDGETDDAYSLVRRADKALYLAKKNGRNRIESYEQP